MKLLNITTSYILILLLTALSLWSFFFYFSIQKEIYENTDEFLSNREFEIIKEVENNSDILNQPSSFKTDFKITQISKKEFKGLKRNFKDIVVFESLEKEYEPYRKLETKFSVNEKYYKLIITEELIDEEEMIDTIRDGVILLYIVLLVLLFFVNRFIIGKLWHPFYTSLQNLKKYRIDKDPHMDFDKTRISEFKDLNQAISDLVKNNYEAYQNQKQFIENASHEMQTPLAKASGKIENLIQDPNLDSKVAFTIQSINEDLDKLSGLNKSLILLFKIENDQFHEKVQVHIGHLVDKICEDFRDFIEFKKIKLEVEKESDVSVTANRYLIEILFRNLIKNSIYHNLSSDGLIHIHVNKEKLLIFNTGKEYEGDTELLFKRFVKRSDNKDSLGLGLSIVKTICNLYDYTISYSVNQKMHRISIRFNQ